MQISTLGLLRRQPRAENKNDPQVSLRWWWTGVVPLRQQRDVACNSVITFYAEEASCYFCDAELARLQFREN